MESQILGLLFDAPDKLVSRQHILLELWERHDPYSSKSLDTYIYHLRKHLKPTRLEIVNVYGSGYMLRDTSEQDLSDNVGNKH